MLFEWSDPTVHFPVLSLHAQARSVRRRAPVCSVLNFSRVTNQPLCPCWTSPCTKEEDSQSSCGLLDWFVDLDSWCSIPEPLQP